MSTLDGTLARIRETGPLGYWGERIYHQLAYGARLSRVRQGEYDGLLDSAGQFLLTAQAAHGAIVREDAMRTEDRIRSLSKEAKRFQMICAAHAHIDMNWMWRWDETVSVTLDSFRTMLDLMKEYPEFKFSQSQASTYRIVEEYAPGMLPEIAARVREGRWEVTASTWVEPDKNMPSGESLVRHILYTKRYLSRLFGLDPATLDIDFEPDTFGHSLHVPEILARGGVKYYYHCRGYDGHNLYRWVSPSGASVIVYREPIWYNAEIQPDMALYVPEFCVEHHMDTMLKVYGVGDHGGGPTRRDIERIRDMNDWPVFPEIRFGTFHEHFASIEKTAHHLPEVRGELNFVFTGCYTTQTRIKKANRVAEAALHEAELFETMSSLGAGTTYHGEAFENAWRNVLFNQFHDIIPGSGVVDTREYAMGLFQNTMATANTNRTLAMRQIAGMIDTVAMLPAEPEADDGRDTTSEGAGVGFGIQEFRLSQTERGRGKTRFFHVFNATPFARDEAVLLIVWDFAGDPQRMIFRDDQGQTVEHQVLDRGRHAYWGHHYMRVLVKVSVPPCGYGTVVLTEAHDRAVSLPFPLDPRVERPHEFVLENRFVKVVFDSQNGSIASWIDKSTGEEMVEPENFAGVFRLIREDESAGMTAWTVGRYMSVQRLLENVRMRKSEHGAGPIRDAVIIEAEFANSSLKATVSLDYDSPALRYSVECHWREVGGPGIGIPQLNFHMPLAYTCSHYVYDVPFGVIARAAMDMDVPANSFAVAVRDDNSGQSIMLVTDSKYGFRGHDDSLAITLIRSSFDPDPYPEFGVHQFGFSVCLVPGHDNLALLMRSQREHHPLHVVSGTGRAGTCPARQSFFCIEEGTVALSALKMAEDDPEARACVVRLYETGGTQTQAVLRFFKKAVSACWIDLNEERVCDQTGIRVDEEGRVSLSVQPHTVVSLRVEWA